MPGNSQRRGAVRKDRKGPAVGSGGQRRKQLKGKGPTPKAVDREKHPAARRARTAAKKKESRRTRPPSRRGGAEYVVGRNAVVEALAAGVPGTALYVAERVDNDERVREAVRLASGADVPVLEAPRAEMDRLADGPPHQGLVLQIPPYQYAHPDDFLEQATTGVAVVALDHVTDPRNLGAVVRSAAAFGARGVVVPERRAAGMTAAAWKTASGAAARVPVARASNLARQLASYRKAGLFIIGLDAAADTDIEDVDADVPLVLVVGAEGPGLSRLVRDNCDFLARIAMTSGNESLNASVAAGIALYALASKSRSTT